MNDVISPYNPHPCKIDANERVSQQSDNVNVQEPKQLLDVFAKLEAQNLVVIQGMQDATAALEEARSKQEVQKARLDAEWSDLYGQVNQLEQAKTKQLQLCSSLRVRGTRHTENREPLNSDMHIYVTCW